MAMKKGFRCDVQHHILDLYRCHWGSVLHQSYLALMQPVDWWILAVMAVIFIAALFYRRILRRDAVNDLPYSDDAELVDGVPIEHVEPS
jgi:hypothetical protein